MTITPWPHQVEVANQALPILQMYNIVYLAMEERTGKTLSAILLAEMLLGDGEVLVITKKNAVQGWLDTLAGYMPKSVQFTVTNYHGVVKIPKTKKFKLVILDEAHSYISGYPKTSALWKSVLAWTLGKPLVFLSATPNAQGPMLLFHQLALSSWSPWKGFKNFYTWYKYYALLDAKGETKKKWIQGRMIDTYADMRNEEVLGTVKHLFITRTRKELGFEHEPEDEKHYVELSEGIKIAYNELMKNKVLEFELNGKDYTLVCDTPIKLRFALHMLEGGVLKVNEDYLVLNSSEKIDYIKATWGDTPDLVIMYNYIAEADKLKSYFKHAKILQATSNAEGVDLSMHKHLVIYSQDFSTSRFTQRRARQANKMREDEIKVHFLLVKGAVSEQVYKTVSVNKTNFVDTTFERIEL